MSKAQALRAKQDLGVEAPRLKGRVLYVGHSYYNTWYLSRALRKLGWWADTLNFDRYDNDLFYHGEDIRLRYKPTRRNALAHLRFYLGAIRWYDIFHFSGKDCIKLLDRFDDTALGNLLPERWDIKLLKKLGKKIVYSNNGCLDGVSQSSFRTWLPEPVCNSCPWRDRQDICSDERNLAWGKLRNSLADYQVVFPGNRKDYNVDPRIHEVPQFYCLDQDFWNPDLLISSNYRLPIAEDTLKIYHSVGNVRSRTEATTNRNIKSTHIYIPTINRLKAEGYKAELIFFHDVPNKELRYYQAQADIVVEMLNFGWFGANVREAMML